MKKIKNSKEILSHGDIHSKQILLEITDETLSMLDSRKRLKKFISYDNNTLRIGDVKWDTSKYRDIYVIGAGKACNHMAAAAEEILGNRIKKGIAIVKKIEPEIDNFERIEAYEGGHPIPNEEGVKASERIIDLIDNAGSDDLFIALISGGSTALMCSPIDGITLDEKKTATDLLLKSGANIVEINSVRRHISKLNGGNLAKRIERIGAELIGIAIYDANDFQIDGDCYKPQKFHGTPIAYDNTTLEDAIRTIEKYNLEEKMPASIVHFLKNCGPEGETPKAFPHFTYFVLNTIPDSCNYAMEVAKKRGIPSMVLTSSIAGESREAGIFLASIAREIQNYERPIKPPCVVICAGETTTTISEDNIIKGHGGPSQELVTSFATEAQDIPGVAILSIDTEGTDGTTDVAGGITDSTTYRRAVEKGIDLFSSLKEHSTYESLGQLRSTIATGNTGTNLSDFNIMYVPGINKKQTDRSGGAIPNTNDS